ncbi:histidine phosphatase family protein [Frigidibacter sp. MR17.24]|uniref:histidine phosphatase family protein n=1 Tax=Frigidibacter sp. MR17.24 TaxID=3127345 RepID=UPI0030130347
MIVDPARDIRRWQLSPTGIARMRAFAASPSAAAIATIRASAETKAIEAAGLLAAARGLPVSVDAEFGENDRSATGFLPPTEFEATADRFFAAPETAVRGWETAVAAQARVVAATARLLDAAPATGDIAIVAHGAVGTLLWCHLAGLPIARSHDQPFQGHFWRIDLPDRRPRHGWRPIAPRA